ncbi:MAG TPA: chemotaxis protein CheW [Polyangiaceae bacterium]|nr:chemotaxis protein CheW [Polyangiaceae bacterium]
MQLNAKRTPKGRQRSLVAFVVGDVRYALDIEKVREIVSPLSLTLLPHTPGGLAGVADHRSEVVPIIDLRARFGLSSLSERSRKSKWILVDVADRTVGLVVDDVMGVLRMSTADFRPPPDLGGGEQARGISSVTTHDGAMVFVLDLARFENLAETFDHSSLLPPGASAGQEGP